MRWSILLVCIGLTAPLSQAQEWDRSPLESAIRMAGEFPVEKPDDVLIKEGLTSDTRKLTQQLESVVAFQPNADVLWPGALIEGKTLQSGILTAIPVRGEDRAPGKIVLTGISAGKKVQKDIDHPSLGTVQQAINDLIASHVLEDQVQPANATFSLHKVYNLDQAMLRLGASAEWMGGSVQASFKKQIQENKASILIRFVQSYYTISFEPPATPSSFLLTQRGGDTLKDHISPATKEGASNPPVYVASVTYGRELWALISSQESEELLESSVKASFSGLVARGSVESETRNRHVLRESKVNVFVLGGSLAEASPILLGEPEKGLEGYIRSGASFSRKSPGAVITYQTRYLGTGNVAKLSSATEYSVPRHRKLTKLKVTYHTYDEDKDPNAQITLAARANGVEVASGTTGDAKELWKDYTIHGPYEIALKTPVPENSIPKMEVQVRQREGGTPAWRMRVHVEGVFDRGESVVLLEYADSLEQFNHLPSEEQHKCFDLRDGHQDTPWITLRLPSVR